MKSAKKTSRDVLAACAKAIRALERPNAVYGYYTIADTDKAAYAEAKRLLWTILQNNGKTIDCDSNHLTEALK